MTKEQARLKAVDRFFEILETIEESDSGREFHPTTINSCRVMVTEELKDVLRIMKTGE